MQHGNNTNYTTSHVSGMTDTSNDSPQHRNRRKDEQILSTEGDQPFAHNSRHFQTLQPTTNTLYRFV